MRLVFAIAVAIVYGVICSTWPATAQAASECATWRTNEFFCDDFESGNLIPPKGLKWGGNNWSITTSAFDGQYALDMFYPALPHGGDNGGSGFIEQYVTRLLGRTTDEFRMRWFEMFTSNWVWSSIASKRWIIQPPGAWPKWGFHVGGVPWGSGNAELNTIDAPGVKNADYKDNISTFPWAGSNLGRWVLIEVHIKLNTPGQQDGVYEKWVDENLVAQHTNVNYRGADTRGVDAIMLSGYWNCYNTDCTCERPSGTNTGDIVCQGNPGAGIPGGTFQDPFPGRPITHADMHRYIDNIVFTEGNTPIGPWLQVGDKTPPASPTGLRATSQSGGATVASPPPTSPSQPDELTSEVDSH